MRVTRRYWELIGLAALLSVGAVVLASPVLLFGVALVGGWIVTLQILFLYDLRSTMDELLVEQTVDRRRVLSGEPTEFTLYGALVRPSSLELRIQGGLPAIATASEPPVVTIEPGETSVTEEFDVEWAVAGTYTLEPARVRAVDTSGLFSAEIGRGTTPTITVEPSGQRSLGVDRTYDVVRRVFGEHEASPIDFGLEPGEVRQYVPGDPLRKIEWKATARLDSTHVRTFESQVARSAVLVIDRRAAMAQGPAGQTKLDYARHLSLLLVEGARRRNDPIGFYAVDESGVDQRLAPTTTNRGYATIRAHLQDLRATGDLQTQLSGRISTEPRHESIAHLSGDDSAFARTFTTFVIGRTSGPRHRGRRPLLSAIDAIESELTGAFQTVIVTDDSDPEAVREAAIAARGGDNRVLVFLTPTVLFDPTTTGDLADAYERYDRFERFRRSLDELDGVEALELGSEKQLSKVMAAGRRQRREARS